MRIQIYIELTADDERKLRELVGSWACPERMVESDSAFKVQLESCCKAGLRQQHDDFKKGKGLVVTA